MSAAPLDAALARTVGQEEPPVRVAQIGRLEPWAQSLRGRAIHLLAPDVETVDFDEIADTLAQIVRYAGCAPRPVVVAQHTLIALEAARRANEPPLVQAMVALHDAHEGHGIGDITTPVMEALAEQHVRIFGPTRRDELRTVLNDLKRAHDTVIHQAAGVPLPSAAQRRVIHHYDLVALATERRDFLSKKPRNWHPDVEAATPLAKRHVLMSPAEAAGKLQRAFRTLLPSLRDGTGRGAR